MKVNRENHFICLVGKSGHIQSRQSHLILACLSFSAIIPTKNSRKYVCTVHDIHPCRCVSEHRKLRWRVKNTPKFSDVSCLIIGRSPWYSKSKWMTPNSKISFGTNPECLKKLCLSHFEPTLPYPKPLNFGNRPRHVPRFGLRSPAPRDMALQVDDGGWQW